MFDINTAANIAEIAGGIAILVSLIYVGYQIRQSNRIASAAALQSVLDGFTERVMNPIIADSEITDIMNRGYLSWESLSTVEKYVEEHPNIRSIVDMNDYRFSAD